ncbi:MAG TPA: RNA polymerase sigma factor RpoD/SigA [Lacunisphaera sp.]|jgi:RNA polymerase primary sigma factor|nr:RNA polymerase sigma factor RpoD/SigA [Lacunisphaera sp.]
MPHRKKTTRSTPATVEPAAVPPAPQVSIPSPDVGLTLRPDVTTAATSRFDVADPVDRRDERSNLQLYLNEIRQTPLLTIEEEIKLAARIKRGDKSARDHMIKANLRLVVKIAYDYAQMGLPLMDLISEGNLGLIKAVERFDPAKGGKLSTYAAWWIKQCMKRALANQSKTIRLPVHLVDKISRMRKTIARLTEELGREPENEEIAAELQIPTAKVALLKTVSVRPASLDAPVGEDDDSATLGDLVGDDNAISPDNGLGEKNLREDLSAMVNSLDPRESSIIKMRFGLEGHKELTLEEVGKKFNVTRERIRQLEYLALSHLRKQMHHHNKQRTADEVEQETLADQRAAVIREYIARQPAAAH